MVTVTSGGSASVSAAVLAVAVAIVVLLLQLVLIAGFVAFVPCLVEVTDAVGLAGGLMRVLDNAVVEALFCACAVEVIILIDMEVTVKVDLGGGGCGGAGEALQVSRMDFTAVFVQ